MIKIQEMTAKEKDLHNFSARANSKTTDCKDSQKQSRASSSY